MSVRLLAEMTFMVDRLPAWPIIGSHDRPVNAPTHSADNGIVITATGAIRFILILAAVCVCGAGIAEQTPAKDITVVAEGFASCPSDASQSSCRQAALADALRRAVEKALGVYVDAETRTRNYRTAQDIVRTSSRGFVRDYRVLDEGPDNSAYHVKIEARVSPDSAEGSLKHICRRLREEVNPAFRISVADPAASAISGSLAALGLRVTTKSGDVEISGAVKPDPVGEVVPETKVYSAGASADLTATDSKANVLPSVPVAIPQPIAGITQDQANRRAVEAVTKLWIERNTPLIAAALLEPGAPIDAGARREADAPVALAPHEAEMAMPTDVLVVPSEGKRITFEPDALAPLARKLKDAVAANPDLAPQPVEVAVARFVGIGISDPAAVEDVLEDLSTGLVKTGVFKLVERARLNEVLRELRIQNSGLVDSSTAKKLGKLIGARAVLVGSISDRKDCYVINARLIDTETGLVSIAESVVIDKPREPLILRAGQGRVQ